MLHGSFANSSPDIRISVTFGFHRRRSVLGQTATMVMPGDAPKVTLHDEKRIFERSAVIQIAIDARAQKYPGERRYRYQPFAVARTSSAAPRPTGTAGSRTTPRGTSISDRRGDLMVEATDWVSRH